MVLHLVLHFVYQSFGPSVFQNLYLRRLAEWGAVQYSTLLCLEGMILAIRYGRSGKGTEDDEVEAPDAGVFFKRHALEVYPLYLVAVAATWAFNLIMTGVGSLSQLFLAGSLVDAWMPNSSDLMSRDPTWLVAALIFYLSFFPALLRLVLPAERATLGYLMATAWASTAVMPLTFVGFDLEIGTVPHLFTLGSTFPLVHMASFVFGVALGLYYLKVDREVAASLSQTFLGTAAAAGLLFFFLSTDIFEGRMLLWCYDGMFLGFTGLILLLVALGKDALLGTVLRFKPLTDSLGPIALTVYLFQGFFVGLAMYVVQSDTGGVFWAAFWVTLLVSAFFLHKTYHLVYLQNVLPYVQAAEEAAAATKAAAGSPSAHGDGDHSSHGHEYPIQGWFWADNILAKGFRLVCYYGAMAFTVAFYMTLALQFNWKGFASVYDMPWANAFVNFWKYMALLSLPSLTFSMVGHIIFPPVLRKRMAPLETLKKTFKHKVFFRIVTRGKHPNLVRSHVTHASNVLRSVLPFNQYCLEVATDAALDLETFCPGMATELLLPKGFAPVGGAKFKARALQYAIEASSAEPGDWIVHLDEETRFDAETVRGVLQHCVDEDEAIARGEKVYGNIGQGVILYGTQEPDNWLTTLADSVRVGDDFGKFRIQYELHEPLIGMHGSFVVSQNAVERLVTFDHGMEGSITEDAYFALVAQVKGIKFSWIDSFMYEQSPFSCHDFMHQRCRWFAGLWLIALSRRIPFLNRAVLLFFMATWAATPLIWLAMTLCMCVASSVPYWFRACIGLISGMSTWGYILGFFFTFKPKDGWGRLVVLFALQLLLQPLFAVMELTGVILGIVAPPTQGFHIVQKEGTKVQKSAEAMSRNNSLASMGSMVKLNGGTTEMV